jgi:hypothetical protein
VHSEEGLDCHQGRLFTVRRLVPWAGLSADCTVLKILGCKGNLCVRVSTTILLVWSGRWTAGRRCEGSYSHGGMKAGVVAWAWRGVCPVSEEVPKWERKYRPMSVQSHITSREACCALKVA